MATWCHHDNVGLHERLELDPELAAPWDLHHHVPRCVQVLLPFLPSVYHFHFGLWIRLQNAALLPSKPMTKAVKIPKYFPIFFV